MTKKEYFHINEPFAALCISVFAYYVLYGIECGINDYAYIAYEAKTNNGVQQVYHKLKIRYTTSGGAYVLMNGRRLKLNEFHRI